MMLPEMAREAPNPAMIGRAVNQKTGSPTPASGPIIPTFTPVMAWSSTSTPLAFSSSRAKVTPIIGEARYGWVLKNSKCRFARSSLVLYNFLMAGDIA